MERSRNFLPNGACVKPRRSPTRESLFMAIEGSPLFELFAVGISKKKVVDYDTLEIFGSIMLSDLYGNSFSLFHRGYDEAKTVFLQDTQDLPSTLDALLILGNSDLKNPRCLPTTFYIDFCLKDKNRNTILVDDRMFFDCTMMEKYDELLSFDFYNNIYVDYCVYQCALLTTVSFILENHGDENEATYAQVSGSIGTTNEMRNMSYLNRIIFAKSEEPTTYDAFNILAKSEEPTTYDAFNILSTFAVPSYSVLEIQIDVWVNDEKIVGSLTFQPCDNSTGLAFAGTIRGEKSWLRIFVEFAHAYSVLAEYPIHEWKKPGTIESVVDEGFVYNLSGSPIIKPMSKLTSMEDNLLMNVQLIHIQPEVEELRNMKWNTYSESYDPDALMEIFSVSVHFECVSEWAAIRGIIRATDGSREAVLFDGDYIPANIQRSNQDIKLKGPRSCLRGEYFGIHCDLKDDEGFEISSGSATYNLVTLSRMYNRRICSVVKGEHGFAILHYSIFSDAAQAKVKFSLRCLDSMDENEFEVGGWAVSRYGNFDYTSSYAKKYYQSILFEESKSVKLIDDDRIPSLKSVVAVPMNSTLFVLAEFRVFSGGIFREVLSYKNSFNPRKPRRPEINNDVVEGSNFMLSVSVEWTGVLCLLAAGVLSMGLLCDAFAAKSGGRAGSQAFCSSAPLASSPTVNSRHVAAAEAVAPLRREHSGSSVSMESTLMLCLTSYE